MSETEKQFREVTAECRAMFEKKLNDYGAAWRLMRPESLTDQIYIKANRARNLQLMGEAQVDEDARSCFEGIVNYGLIALIQLDRGYADTVDMSAGEAIAAYDRHLDETLRLMLAKNHDYGEAWRRMRVSSYTDLILMKINRTKQIEDHGGKTEVSEGVAANYMDMINYSVFALIKLRDGEQ